MQWLHATFATHVSHIFTLPYGNNAYLTQSPPGVNLGDMRGDVLSWRIGPPTYTFIMRLSDSAGGLSSVIMWMSPSLIAWMMGIGLKFLSLWQSTVNSREKISHSSRNAWAAVCSFPPSGEDIGFISSASLSVSACCPSSPVLPPPLSSGGGLAHFHSHGLQQPRVLPQSHLAPE